MRDQPRSALHRESEGLRALWPPCPAETLPVCAVAGLSCVALLTTLIQPPAARLVWNASPSSPIGLYVVQPGKAGRRGETVVAWPPAFARTLALERRYLPAGVPLVKFIAAAEGERVCAAGEAIFVNGRFSAARRRLDRRGRPLPWWNGCFQLGAGELFLLAPSARDSFDGRYFGVTGTRDVLGAASLIWRL